MHFLQCTSLMLYLLPRHCSDQQCCAVTCIWVLLKPNRTDISSQLRQTLPFPDSTNGCTSSCRTGCKECIDIGNKGSRSSFDWQHPKHTYFGGKMLGAVQIFDLLENKEILTGVSSAPLASVAVFIIPSNYKPFCKLTSYLPLTQYY